MKYLVPFLLFLTGCAHTPMLEEGSCYRAVLPDRLSPVNSGVYHYLMSFKVLAVSNLVEGPSYEIRVLDIFGDPVEPGAYSWGYVSVDTFDRYFSPNVYPFNFGNPGSHIVKCNPIREQPPLRITGRKP